MQPQNRRIPIVRAESSRRLSSTLGAAPWRRCSRRWGTRRERAGRAPLGRHDAPPDELGGARRRAACLIGGLATIPSRNLQSQIASLGPVASAWPRPTCPALILAHSSTAESLPPKAERWRRHGSASTTISSSAMAESSIPSTPTAIARRVVVPAVFTSNGRAKRLASGAGSVQDLQRKIEQVMSELQTRFDQQQERFKRRWLDLSFDEPDIEEDFRQMTFDGHRKYMYARGLVAAQIRPFVASNRGR